MLHHIEIYVSHLERSRIFYDRLLPTLGYQLYQDWEQGFSYRKEHHYLVFVQTEEAFLEVGYHRKRIGLNHLAFEVSSRADLDQFREDFRKRNLSLLYDETYPYAGGEAVEALYVEDPDRIKIELVVRKEIDDSQ